MFKIIDRHTIQSLQDTLSSNFEEAFFLSFDKNEDEKSFYINDYLQLEEHKTNLDKEHIMISSKAIISLLKICKDNGMIFSFCHSHVAQKSLSFSITDIEFEEKVIRAGRKMGYEGEYIFLILSKSDVIGHIYQSGTTEPEEILICYKYEKSLIRNVKIGYSADYKYGFIYNKKTNEITRLAAEAAKSYKKLQDDFLLLRSISNEENTVNEHLNRTFVNRELAIINKSTLITKKASLRIIIQNGCNLNCKYCYAEAGTYKKNYGHFSIEQAQKTINKLIEMGINHITDITFFGGEPSLFPREIGEFCQVCESKQKNGLLVEMPKFYMITNAYHLSEECINIIKKYNIILTVSLDGPKIINDQLRVSSKGEGTYDRIIANINRLKNEGIDISLVEATYTSLHQMNGYWKKELEDIIKRVAGTKHVVVCNCQGEYEPDKDLLRKEQENELRQFHINLRNKELVKLTDSELNTIYSITRKLNSSETSPLFCKAGVSSFAIDSKGDLYPCHLMMDKDCILENIFDSNASLENIVKKASFLEKYTKDNTTICQLCWYAPFCKGCPAQIRSNNKTIDDDVCAYKRDKAEQFLLYYVNFHPQEREILLNDIRSILNERDAR